MLSWFRAKKRPGIGKKVFVGVSGGVDSSVSAALLKDQGYDVVGVFIRTWQPEWIQCTWRDERRDAMRVCAYLNIPFIELDLEREYKEGVADYMIREYRAGRTPNPDVMCNREVKFGGFLSWALAQGADYVATGHYARIAPSPKLGEGWGEVLMKGFDDTKDQSYFLWTLTNDQLSHILFPVGGMKKPKVRKLAEKYDLPTAEKKDSQGVCFIGEIDMKEFLSHYIPQTPGDVVNESGEVIGTHPGASLFTLGERHGLTITKKTPNDKSYYVIKKDIQSNRLVVSQNPTIAQTGKDQLQLSDCVWRIEPDAKKTYQAQVRYHGTFMPAMLEYNENVWKVTFETSDYTIAPGQSIVVYDDDICLGGGIVC